MSIAEIISTCFQKENCKCYERYLKGKPDFSSLKIVPDENFCLKFSEKTEDELTTTLIDGYVQISRAMLDELFSKYEAVEEVKE